MKLFKKQLRIIATIIVCSFGVIFIINSCRKYDRIVERMHRDNTRLFFNVPNSVLPIVKKVATFIKKQNDKDQFIDRIAKRNGIPRWDKARVVTTPMGNSRTTGSPDSIVLIPTIQVDSNIVHSFLACHVEGDNVKIKIFDGAAYRSYPHNNRLDTISSSFVTLTCMLLDYVVSNGKREWYTVKDSTILDTPHHVQPVNGIRYLRLIPANHNPLALAEPVTFTYCVTIWIPNNGQLVGANPGGPDPNTQGSYQTVCTDYTFWANVIDEDPIYSGPPPVGGGGGSGGNWYDPSNQACKAMPGDDPCGSGAPLPFQPIFNDLGQYNVYTADTVGYSSSLQTAYPCEYHLIHDSLQNENFLAQLAGTNVFNDSAYMHLTFDTSTTLTQPGQASAETLAGGTWIDPSTGFTHFHATITFNGYFLRNSTKEAKISTIIHECMHAIFKMRWGQYQQWLLGNGNIDSNFIKTHFPIHWYYITQQAVPPSELQDHEMMATDYVNLFSSLGRPLYNVAATTAQRDTTLKAIGYGGLAATTAWGLLPSQGMDTCKYRKIQVTGEYSLAGGPFTTGGSCLSFYANFSTDFGMTAGCY
jgi:hypothetical protein